VTRLGDCLLWAVFEKYRRSPNFGLLYFHVQSWGLHKFGKICTGLGYIWGRFFHKRICSPLQSLCKKMFAVSFNSSLENRSIHTWVLWCSPNSDSVKNFYDHMAMLEQTSRNSRYGKRPFGTSISTQHVVLRIKICTQFVVRSFVYTYVSRQKKFSK
jgi:hypothetical protein